jgi:hypothetical protein
MGSEILGNFPDSENGDVSMPISAISSDDIDTIPRKPQSSSPT